MTRLPHSLAPALVCLLSGASLPALAASSAASSASEGVSASVGSVSTSFQASSNSSDTRPNRTADGDYRVTEVAEAEGARPGMVRLMLAPAAGEGEPFALVLPKQAAETGRVTVGDMVRAQNRPYGVEFARADTRQPFFLVLEDAWYRELDSHPVTL